MKRKPPFREGRVHVLSQMCSTCVLRPGNLMHLGKGRLKDLVQQNLDADAALTCHATLDGEEALCRGFVDAYGDRTTPLRALAAMPWMRRDVDPPDGAANL